MLVNNILKILIAKVYFIFDSPLKKQKQNKSASASQNFFFLNCYSKCVNIKTNDYLKRISSYFIDPGKKNNNKLCRCFQNFLFKNPLIK